MTIDTSALQHAKIIQCIGFIGYGIVGKSLAAALKPQTQQGVAWVGAWDVLFDDMRDLPDHEMERAEAVAKRERQHARDRGIAAAGSVKQLCETATLIISCVTASNTLAVAEEVAKSIKRGAYFLDVNSVSPSTKQACAIAIEAAGGHYVAGDLGMPMVLRDTHAAILAAALAPLGFDAKIAEQASESNHSLIGNFMLELATLADRGQIVIPKTARDALGLRPDMKLDVGLQDNQIVMRKRVKLDFDKWLGTAPDDGLTSQALLDDIRGRNI